MHQYNHIHDGVEEDLSCSWSEDTDSRDRSPAIDGTKAGLEEIQCNCLSMEIRGPSHMKPTLFNFAQNQRLKAFLRTDQKLVASQLQTALEQIQAAGESEALSTSELRGLQEERHHEKASFAAEVSKLVQQGLGKESICLMNGCKSTITVSDQRGTVVRNKVDKAILEGCRRDDKQITTQGKEHAKSLDLEKLKTLSMMYDLGKWVQRPEEEENRQWVTACNESRHSRQNESVAEGLLAECDWHERNRATGGAEFGTESRVPRWCKSNYRQIEKLEFQKRQHLRRLEVETLKYLSVIEKSHERLQRLEEENKRLVTSNDECGQSLKDALQEIMLLANELAKLEQEKDLQMGRTLQQEAALQKAQEQLQAASERDVDQLVQDRQRRDVEVAEELGVVGGENARLKKEIGKLEAEKDRQEGERLELVAGLQTVWEKLQAANEHGQGAIRKKRFLNLCLREKQGKRRLLGEKVTWKEQLEAEKSKLQSESENLKSVSEDLNEQLQRSGEEIGQLGMRSAELSKMLEEATGRKGTVSG
ncbi:unnamed protein product [Sphagnum balticum]